MFYRRFGHPFLFVSSPCTVGMGIVLLLCTLVIALEFVNSVIEKCVDLICPHYDERAKTIKDLMAGAVLFVSLAAAGIFVIILGGKII